MPVRVAAAKGVASEARVWLCYWESEGVDPLSRPLQGLGCYVRTYELALAVRRRPELKLFSWTCGIGVLER